MHGAGHNAAHAGNEARVVAHCDDASRGADNVHNVARTRTRAHRIPMRIERAHRDRNASAKPEFLGPLWRKLSRELVARRVLPLQLRANTFKQRINFYQKVFRRQAS